MAKSSSIYICSNCDAQSPKWSGRCLECGAWGTLVEQVAKPVETKKHTAPAALMFDLADIKSIKLDRISTNISEVDQVLGGGLVPGSLILLSGEPGIGKSTIVAQIANTVSKENQVIYVSGEESGSQVKDRFDRLSNEVENIKFISNTDIEQIAAAIETTKPKLAIIDSIQTVATSLMPGEAGSVSQIRASAARLLETAKKNDIAIIIIGHITKDGTIAGPKSLEHIVDTVIYLETDDIHNFRILRSTKNRFGSVNEVGIFDMTSTGFKEIKNPSAIFLEKADSAVPGSVISCVMEGTRPFLVEIQALVTKTVFGYPQRKASGFDLNRLQVLIAVMAKRAKVNLMNQDVILNVVGGMKINDPSLDLAVCLAIASSLLNLTIDNKTIVIGEVGLGGEIRKAGKLDKRLNEADKLGFARAIVPDCDIKTKNIKLEKIKNIFEVSKFLK